MAEALLRLARKFGPYHITSSCRSTRQQERLYKAYLAGESDYPVAPPGHSAHQRGLAIDIARDDMDPHSDLFLHTLGQSWAAADPALRWSATDPIHFEYRPN
jgi:LAS superfamily LD-carboxypeptidase LdcB